MKIFNMDEEFVRKQCEPGEVQHDSNQPVYPDKNYWEVMLKNSAEMSNDKDAQKIFRNA